MNEESLFAEALGRTGEARAALLDEHCKGDAELRRRVEALLRAADNPDPFLEAPAPAPAATVDQPPAAERPGAVIGPYKLIEPVGEGGMGAVWMAQQTEPVRRLVALKLIKAGMDSRQVIARFEAERQALALMDHPNIARVVEAGTTAAGRPYFVMDLVKGVPITRYCDEHRLTPRQRLELVIPVCSAVQHAHQKGVIHRDLKPSNVLVALYDGKPVPKVIDFGVAKAAGLPLTDRTLVTGFGAVVGTPEYMSPEQAELNSQDVDTRSDVYSLGVLLYELLTGTTPFSRRELEGGGLLEMLRAIREQEPAKPSARLSTAEGLPALAANRGTEPAKLARLVRGELDWIAMRALEKDRNRRYETASALAADVGRYLNDEPVLACPPSARYRLGKLLRRNRGPVLAAGLVLLALFVGSIGGAYGLVEARKQWQVHSLWQQAERERHAAEVARGEAELARDGEKKARREAEAWEYGRTMEVTHQEWRDNNVPAALALLHGTRADLRGWEWHYVHRLCHSALLTLEGHKGVVTSASFSADGSRVVTGSDDRTARVWDARCGKAPLTLEGHEGVVTSASFSADGARVVTGSHDKTAKVWDASSGKALLTLEGHKGVVTSASFSADGARVVTTGGDGTARVWDARSGKALFTLEGHTAGVTSASFSADGSRVLTTGGDGTARVWDAKSAKVLLTLKLEGHTEGIGAASFSADGSRVVTGGHDRMAQVWDAQSGEVLLRLEGHTEVITSASFSADGARVLTGSDDRTARVWDAKTGEALFTLKGHTAGVTSASFSADGARVVTGSIDNTARVWGASARSGNDVFTLALTTVVPRSASFSADGSRIVTVSEHGTATVWDDRSGEELLTREGYGYGFLTLMGHTGSVQSASFSADGARVVTGGIDKTAKVWDAKSGKALLTLTGHTAGVQSASFSADGARVVTGSHDKTAKVWDARSGKALFTLEGHEGVVTSASFSADGARVVTASHDKTAKVWDARSGKALFTLEGHTEVVTSASFSADGARVVTGSHDWTAKVWDAKSGKALFTLEGHTEVVKSASFGPDGSRVLTGSDDKTAKVWDARTGAALLTLKGHTSPVTLASWSADGSRVLTTSRGITTKVWDAGPVSREALPKAAAPPRPAK